MLPVIFEEAVSRNGFHTWVKFHSFAQEEVVSAKIFFDKGKQTKSSGVPLTAAILLVLLRKSITLSGRKGTNPRT